MYKPQIGAILVAYHFLIHCRRKCHCYCYTELGPPLALESKCKTLLSTGSRKKKYFWHFSQLQQRQLYTQCFLYAIFNGNGADCLFSVHGTVCEAALAILNGVI